MKMAFVAENLCCGVGSRGRAKRLPVEAQSKCDTNDRSEAAKSRSQVIAPVSRRCFLASFVLLGAGISFEAAAESEEVESVLWNGPNNLGYSFRYPNSWKATKKQIKTHANEVMVVKSGTSASAGIVVDPVKINSLQEFGTPELVAEKVLGVEKKKDGFLSVQPIGVKSFDKGGVTFYQLEYEVENTHGSKHFVSNITINDKKLYVFTIQAKVKDFDGSESELRSMLDSFSLNSSKI